VAAERTLGRGLGRALALASVLGMLVFAVVVAIAIYAHEVYDPTPEDPPLEITEEVAVAFAVALPFGVGLSLMINRALTHATTERLDAVIASTQRMTAERLDERLPVGKQEDALDHMSRALNDVLDRIESGVSAQRQFAADASHELRTPMAVMSTNLEVARRKPRDVAHWERVADDVLAEMRRMNLLVDKLLMLARTGEAGLHHAPTDLRGLAEVAVDRAQLLAKERGVTVELAGGPEVKAELDAEAVTIVIDNLLRNAIDHTPKGEHIIVRVESGPRLLVEDRGPGVPADQRERIFQPFARGTQQKTDRAVGTGVGLGLAICRRIVAGHHGSIAVEDREGGGSRFVVTLPAAT
jgi:two-component system OmpR family sensor kinase